MHFRFEALHCLMARNNGFLCFALTTGPFPHSARTEGVTGTKPKTANHPKIRMQGPKAPDFCGPYSPKCLDNFIQLHTFLLHVYRCTLSRKHVDFDLSPWLFTKERLCSQLTCKARWGIPRSWCNYRGAQQCSAVKGAFFSRPLNFFFFSLVMNKSMSTEPKKHIVYHIQGSDCECRVARAALV